jgi:hypothetical protein
MEPENWVALAAVAATVVAMILGYLQGQDNRRQTERLAQGERQHARTLARDDRMFDARRNAYESTLDLIQHRWLQVASRRWTTSNGEGSPEPFSREELDVLRSRLGLYASKPVLSKLDELESPLSRYAVEIGRLGASEELMSKLQDEDIDELPDEFTDSLSNQREIVAEAVQELRASLDALSRLMQEHLEGRDDGR